MRDSTKLFLFSVVPSIASAAIMALSYFGGYITLRCLLIGLLSLASVWVVGFAWGYIDWKFRRMRRRKRRRTNSI